MSTSSSRKRGRFLHCQSASSADGLVERFAAWQRRHAWRHLSAVERVWAISDLHMEHEANFDFVSGLAGFERDALVVAGDVCTSLALLRSALKLLAERFRHVFYVVGNHELWHDAQSDGADSFEKLLACYEAATAAGAHAAPALLGSSSGGVAIVPLQSWYHFGFLGGGPAADMPAGHALRMMDSGCVWPGALGGSSTAAGLARFFARCNEESLSQALSAEGRAWLLGRAGQEEDAGREEEDAGQEENAGQEEGASGGKRQKRLPAVERAVAGARRRSRAGRRSVGQSAGAQGGPPERAGDRRAVVSFSHFLPRAELHRTHPSRLGDRLGDVEGSALLGEQAGPPRRRRPLRRCPRHDRPPCLPPVRWRASPRTCTSSVTPTSRST